MEGVFLVQLFLDDIFVDKGATLVQNFVQVFLLEILTLLLWDLDGSELVLDVKDIELLFMLSFDLWADQLILHGVFSELI